MKKAAESPLNAYEGVRSHFFAKSLTYIYMKNKTITYTQICQISTIMIIPI